MPSPRISHMKSKRSWPGVPNRYSTRSRSIVIRPKSIATVVSFFRDRVSSVMPFSVDSTVISLIVRISVVLPAANGPVTTILTAVPWLRRFFVVMSQPPHAGDQPQKQALVHARVPFDEWRGGGSCRRATRGGGNLRRDRLRVFGLALGQERLGALRRHLVAVTDLRGHDRRTRRVDRGDLRHLLVDELVVGRVLGREFLDRCGRGRLGLSGCGRRGRSRGLEPGEQAVTAQQRLDAVLAVTGAKQSSVHQVGERGHHVVVAAAAQRDHVADRALTVDERKQRPLVTAELWVVGRGGGQAEHGLRRRDRRGDVPPALQP